MKDHQRPKEERLNVPYNTEAEEAVLGSIIMDPPALWKVLDTGLLPEHFYIEKWGWILTAMIELEQTSQHIDFMTVTDYLDRQNLLEPIGGAAAISELLSKVPTSLHAESYAKIVLGTSKRRTMMRLASEMAQGATTENEALDDVIHATETAIYKLGQTSGSRKGVTLATAVSAVYQQLSDSLDQDGPQTDVPILYRDLRDMLGGFYNSDLYLVAARPGVGKTALLCQLALDSAKAGKRVMLFSAEMAWSQVAARLIAIEGQIDSQHIRRRTLDESEWNAFARIAPDLSGLQIFIDDTPFITPFQIRSKVRQYGSIHGKPDIVMVDYIQLMSSGMRMESRNHEVGFIAKALKSLAKEMEIPVIAASQLSRAVEQRQDKRPMLSDLRDSGELEQDADTVMFLYRDEMYNSDSELQNILDIIVAKHRHGKTGVASLFFRKSSGSFHDAVTYNVDLSNVRL